MGRKSSASTDVSLYREPASKAKAGKVLGATARTATAGSIAAALVLGFSLPAYAEDAYQDPMTLQIRTVSPQQLEAADAEYTAVPMTLEQAQEIFVEPEPQPADEATQEADQPVAAADNQAEEAPEAAPANVKPASGGSAALASAIFNQIGVAQDCTDAVQNALAELGYVKRRDQGGPDLGVRSFTQFGTSIPVSQAQPGDILFNGGHVFVYLGNNAGVHGGFNGFNTQYYQGSVSSPGMYTGAVRLP